MIYYRNDVRGSGVDARAVKAKVRKLLAAVKEKDSSISISFVSDGEIRKLNKTHRGKDKPTDVLSFPLVEEVPNEPFAVARDRLRASNDRIERMLGDIVISVDTARRQAADYDAALATEVDRLLIHGVLHIMGHDHEELEERAIMEAEERRLADVIGMEWPYL